MKYFFLDTETTGLNYKEHGIIQIGGIVEIDGKVEVEIDLKCQPFSFQKISKESLDINKVTVKDIQKFMPPEKAFRELISILDSFVNRYEKDDKFFLVGYNAFFDNCFLHEFFENNHEQYFSSYFWWPPIDVAVLFQEVMKEYRHKFQNFKLENIAAILNIDVTIHDALSDAKACRELYKRLQSGNIYG